MFKISLKFLIIFCFFISQPSFADEKTDTIVTTHGDQVIVSYEVGYVDRAFQVRFNEVKKILGPRHRKKFDDMENVKALVFDRAGNHKDCAFTGEKEEAFQVPTGTKYDKENAFEDGFVAEDGLEGRTLVFDNKDGKNHQLKIPIFLGHYSEKNLLKLRKKSKYELFTKCEPLIIDLNVPVTKQTRTVQGEMISSGGVVEQTQEVFPSEFGDYYNPSSAQLVSDDESAKNLISIINEQLPEQKDGIDETLAQQIGKLIELQGKVSEPVRAEIKKTLSAYNQLKKEISPDPVKEMEQEAAEVCDEIEKMLPDLKDPSDPILMSKMATLNELQRNPKISPAVKDKMKETLASCKEKIDDLKRKSEKKKWWMIIGAALLGILGFAGNQFGQYFRNRKNMKGMQDMQDRIVKRAEDEARRRGQSMMRQKMYQAQGTVKGKVRDATKNTVRRVIGEDAPTGQTIAKPKATTESASQAPRYKRAAVKRNPAQPKRNPNDRRPGSSNHTNSSDNVSI